MEKQLRKGSSEKSLQSFQTRATAWQNQQNDEHPAKTQNSLGMHPVWSVFAVHLRKVWVFSYL